MTLTSICATNRLRAAEPLPQTSLCPGVLLTFDDSHNIPYWHAQCELFRRYSAKATLFLNDPASLSPEQIEQLRDLARDGFAIGVHGVHHVKSVDYLKEHSEEDFLEKEILPAIQALRENGFEPTSFAYPMSQNDEQTDRLLSKYFRHARTGRGVPPETVLAEMDCFFVPVDDIPKHFTLVGRGCDMTDEESLEQNIFPALERAKERGEILVFYDHCITSEAKSHYIRPAMFEKILQKVQELGLVFYTYDELP